MPAYTTSTAILETWCFFKLDRTSASSCRVRIRLDDGEDPKPVFGTVQSLLVSHKCRLQSSALYEDKGQMVFLLYIPAGVDPRNLEAEVRSKLRKSDVSKIDVDVV